MKISLIILAILPAVFTASPEEEKFLKWVLQDQKDTKILPAPSVVDLPEDHNAEYGKVVEFLEMTGLVDKVNSDINSQNKEKCPFVEKKSNCPEISERTECWSPGSLDVDCPTGNSSRPFGLCCFDGCQNSCPKVCREIMVKKNVKEVVKQCTNSHRKECQQIPETKCHQECKMVDNIVKERIPQRVCETKNDKKCEKVVTFKEQCRTWNEKSDKFRLSPQASECPKPQQNPTDCNSNCWSPGVADVDCPMGPSGTKFGLCCFNGCANKCLDNKPQKLPENCKTITTQKCSSTEDLLCQDNQEPFCEKITRKTCRVLKKEDEGCKFFHNRKFAESHKGQTIPNINSRDIVWQDKCNPQLFKDILLKNQPPKSPPRKECEKVCKEVQVMKEVTKEKEECIAQPVKEVCHQEVEKVCNPLSYVSRPIKSKSWTKGWSKGWSKGDKGLIKGYKGHHIKKREAHNKGYKSKGHWKGWKGDNSHLYGPGYVCTDLIKDKCEYVEQPAKCQMVQYKEKIPVMEKQCKEICREIPADDLACHQDLFVCPEGDSPAFELCFSVNETVGSSEVEYCYKKGEVPLCKKVRVERCVDHHQVVCKECTKIPKETENCKIVPKQECKNEMKEVEKIVPKRECQEKCKQMPVEKCKQVPYQECKPVEIVKEKKFPKIVCQ